METRCLSCNLKGVVHTCGCCTACCACEMCSNCQSVSAGKDTCPCCTMCSECCHCIRVECNHIVIDEEYVCRTCGRCISCCTANTRNDHHVLFYTRPVNLARYEQEGRRLISAEIEVTHLKSLTLDTVRQLNDILSAWNCSVVRDGSIPDGIEINTHPATGDFWTAMITDISAGLYAAKAIVKNVFGPGGAGCHIHINCLDHSYLDMLRLIRLLACVEPALYALIPKGRRKSHYCVVWCWQYRYLLHEYEITHPEIDELGARYVLTEGVYGFSNKRGIEAARKEKYGATRYRGVNFHSYFYRGTVEFRMPPGMTIAVNIINWGLILERLVSYAFTSTPDYIKSVCKPVDDEVFSSGFLEHHRLSPDIPSRILKLSVELLQSLISPTLQDWVRERMKWAQRDHSDNEYVE